MTTPRRDGFAMPAEWAPHAAAYMEWPTLTRKPMWGDLFDAAERDWAAVANAIADFEPVVMVVHPDQAATARKLCGDRVELLELPIDDSWMRDNGPIFVTDDEGRVSAVHFEFNAWGEKFTPYDRDAEVPRALAEHLGMRLYVAPLVLEGGSFFVDGEATLITTEQCLLHPNRNPRLTREQIEEHLREYLGVSTIIWLDRGYSKDRDTDGHIDAVLQYVEPGVVMLLAPADPSDPDHESGRENLRRLHEAQDAKGRRLKVIEFDPGSPGALSYMNFYLPNGAAIVPVAASPTDEIALEQIRRAFPDRVVVPVEGRTIAEGGGGPHCITQQLPLGIPAQP